VEGEGRSNLNPLKLTEPRFALIHEDVRDRATLLNFDRPIRVAKLNAQQGGQRVPDGCLSRSGRADENHEGTRAGPLAGPRAWVLFWVLAWVLTWVTHHECRLSGMPSR
jgi:hypothetical protein